MKLFNSSCLIAVNNILFQTVFPFCFTDCAIHFGTLLYHLTILVFHLNGYANRLNGVFAHLLSMHNPFIFTGLMVKHQCNHL